MTRGPPPDRPLVMLGDHDQENDVKEGPSFEVPMNKRVGDDGALMLGDHGQENKVKEGPLPLPEPLVDVCCFACNRNSISAHRGATLTGNTR